MAWSRLGLAEFARGDTDAAIYAAKKALQLSSEVFIDLDPPAILASVRVLVAAGESEIADRYVTDLGERGQASDVLRYAAASLAAHAQEFELAITRLEGVDSPTGSILRGYFLLELGQFQPALREFRRARLHAPDSALLFSNMAYAYAGLGSPAKALRMARSSWIARDKSPEASVELAYYLIAAGEPDEALKLLSRARRDAVGNGPDAFTVPIVRAHLAAGDVEKAKRELKRAISVPSEIGSPVVRAELAANIEYLRWTSHEITRDQLKVAIRQHLNACDYGSVPLAQMLADISESTSAHIEIAAIYERLRRDHGEAELAGLRWALSALAADWESELRCAEYWGRVEPLNPRPFAIQLYLAGCVLGDLARASKLARLAVQRFPGVPALRNNAAYSLALAGHVNEAERMLRGLDDDPYVRATRGLIALLRNNITEGIALYEDAIARARVQYQPDDAADFEARVGITLRLLSVQCGIPDAAARAFPVSPPPPGWRSLTSWLALQYQAERLKIDWPVRD